VREVSRRARCHGTDLECQMSRGDRSLVCWALGTEGSDDGTVQQAWTMVAGESRPVLGQSNRSPTSGGEPTCPAAITVRCRLMPTRPRFCTQPSLVPLDACYLGGLELSSMATAMKLRDVVRALTTQQCTTRSDDGNHTKWICPCGRHSANIPRHRIVSPGVVRDTIKRLDCLPEGWLQ
jgi:hypothetical protein